MSENPTQPALRSALEFTRSERRKRAHSEARIVSWPDHSTASCVMTEKSNSGARVCLDAPQAAVPDTFYLVVAGETVAFEARAVWREGAVLGLKLTAQRDLKSVDAGPEAA